MASGIDERAPSVREAEMSDTPTAAQAETCT